MSNKIQKAIDYLENMGPIYGESAGMSDWQADAALDTLLAEFDRLQRQRDDLLAACEALAASWHERIADDRLLRMAQDAIAKAKGEAK